MQAPAGSGWQSSLPWLQGSALERWVQSGARRPMALRLALAGLSGLLFSIASPDHSVFLASFVCWIPMLLAIRGQSWKGALGYSTLTGTVAVLISYGWMVELTGRFGGLPVYASWLVHLLFSSLHGLEWGFAGLLAHVLGRGDTKRVPWLLALTWACMEIFFPALFPVNGGFFWADHPRWIQSAEFGGSPLVAALHLLCNVLLLRLAQAQDKRAILLRSATAVGIMGAIPALGAWRMAAVSQAMQAYPQLPVGVVQGNAGIDTRRNIRTRVLGSLQESSAKLQRQGAKLLVWGETVYPFRGFYRDSTVDYPPGDPRRVQVGFDAPLLFGLTTYDKTESWRRPYNTAWLMEEGGALGPRYDKAKPLWFGEYVPLVDPDWYLDTFPNASYLTAGPGPAVLEWGDVRLGPMICYEVLLSDYVRETVDKGVHVLVNMTNDSWFGATREQGEHLALTVVRAVETRRPLVRAVSAGISAYIDPNGVMVNHIPRTDSDSDGYHGAEGFLATVPLVDPEHRTVFVRIGGAFKIIYPILTMLLAFLLHRRAGATSVKST